MSYKQTCFLWADLFPTYICFLRKNLFPTDISVSYGQTCVLQTDLFLMGRPVSYIHLFLKDKPLSYRQICFLWTYLFAMDTSVSYGQTCLLGNNQNFLNKPVSYRQTYSLCMHCQCSPHQSQCTQKCQLATFVSPSSWLVWCRHLTSGIQLS